MGATASVLGCGQSTSQCATEGAEEIEMAQGISTPSIISKTTDNDNDLLAFTTAHLEEINCLAVSFDNSLVASGSEDFSVRVWETERFECVRELLGHRDYITCLTFAGKSLLTGSADTTIKKWDLLSGDCHFVSYRSLNE